MSLSIRDIPALGRPLLALALVAGLSAGGILFAERLVKDARGSLTKAQAELGEARKRVHRSGEERDTILRYVGPYHTLAQRGIVGEEQRLAWVDALRVANNQAQLYGVEYEVGAQQAYAFAAEAGAGALPIQQSIMKLKFGMLYEDDLLSFFRALAAQDVGAFTINQCVLQRLVPEVVRPANAATLRAECEVAWITIPAPVPAEGTS
ncbi:MAG TPA: hypothetical protein VFU53_09715 [Burkholderiales bacterium]|nr:hypothetical protein [Burkholderiales bacterium]